jgi:hypothetical protein
VKKKRVYGLRFAVSGVEASAVCGKKASELLSFEERAAKRVRC